MPKILKLRRLAEAGIAVEEAIAVAVGIVVEEAIAAAEAIGGGRRNKATGFLRK